MSKHFYNGPEPPTAIPPLEELDRYFRGELGPEDRKRLEAQIQDDPLLADMLEGLEQVKDPQVIQQTLSRISTHTQRKLANRTNKREQLQKRRFRVQPRTYHQLSMAVAAGMAFLIVSVWLFRKLPGDQATATSAEELISMNDEPIPMQVPPALTEEMLQKGTEPEEFYDPPTDAEGSAPVALSLVEEDANEEQDVVVPPTASSRNLTSGNISPAPQGEEVPGDEMLIAQAEEKEIRRKQEESARMLAELEQQRRRQAEMQKATEERRREEALATAAPKPTLPATPIVTDSVVVNHDNGFLNLSEIAEDRTPEIGNSGSGGIAAKDYATNSIPPRDQNPSAAKAKKARMADSEYQVSSWKHAYAGLPRTTDEERLQGELMRAGAMAELLEEAIQLYNQAHYSDARFKLDEVLVSSPENVVAKYFMASSYVLEEQYEAALPYYREVINYPEGTFYQDARWELANAYLELGKKRQARKLLEQIAAQAGDYQQAAQAQLKKLR